MYKQLLNIFPQKTFIFMILYQTTQKIGDLCNMFELNQWCVITLLQILLRNDYKNQGINETFDLFHLYIDAKEMSYYLSKKIPEHKLELEFYSTFGTKELLIYLKNIKESFKLISECLVESCQPFITEELENKFVYLKKLYLNKK